VCCASSRRRGSWCSPARVQRRRSRVVRPGHACSPKSAATHAGDVAQLLGLRRTPQFRTNISLFNPSTEGGFVHVRVFTQRGTWREKSRTTWHPEATSNLTTHCTRSVSPAASTARRGDRHGRLFRFRLGDRYALGRADTCSSGALKVPTGPPQRLLCTRCTCAGTRRSNIH